VEGAALLAEAAVHAFQQHRRCVTVCDADAVALQGQTSVRGGG
jgi:hypothetical protein